MRSEKYNLVFDHSCVIVIVRVRVCVVYRELRPFPSSFFPLLSFCIPFTFFLTPFSVFFLLFITSSFVLFSNVIKWYNRFDNIGVEFTAVDDQRHGP